MKFPVNEPEYTGKTKMNIADVIAAGFTREVDCYWHPVAQAVIMLVGGEWKIVKLKDLANNE